MGTPESSATAASDAAHRPWRAPRVWRIAMRTALIVCKPLCRLRVAGEIPDRLRDGPIILAANHIGAFDAVVMTAECARMGLAPRILAEGGLFRAPGFGAVMRVSGHLPVDRMTPTVIDALPMANGALDGGAVVLAYPEGRITLDPGMWLERGKSGLARLAIATGAPVIPVAQWGAHLIMPWGVPRRMIRRLMWAMVRRPVVRVQFGAPVSLDDLMPDRGNAGTGAGGAPTGGAASSGSATAAGTATVNPAGGSAVTAGAVRGNPAVTNVADRTKVTADPVAASPTTTDPVTGSPGRSGRAALPTARDVRRATDRIIDAITDELRAIRPDEPRLPGWIDPWRPITTLRTHRYRGSSGWPAELPPA